MASRQKLSLGLWSFDGSRPFVPANGVDSHLGMVSVCLAGLWSACPFHGKSALEIEKLAVPCRGKQTSPWKWWGVCDPCGSSPDLEQSWCGWPAESFSLTEPINTREDIATIQRSGVLRIENGSWNTCERFRGRCEEKLPSFPTDLLLDGGKPLLLELLLVEFNKDLESPWFVSAKITKWRRV